jgi:tRNA U34 2-thiouridine synthase MnmA/TrmU
MGAQVSTPPPARVLVGFTGGPRSSVTAVLLKTQDQDVLGAFIDYSNTAWDTHCRRDVRKTVEARAQALGISLVVVPVASLFDALVMDPAVHDILNRRMPQTCLHCHSRVLIPALSRIADEHGITSIATGHRATIHRGELLRTENSDDQADWLAFLPRKLLERLQLPLGTFSSQQIDKLAKEIEGIASTASDSPRSTCELAGTEWLSWANARTPIDMHAPGPICHRGSISLAEHRGIFEFPMGSTVPVDRGLIQDPRASTSEPLLAVGHEQASHTLKVQFESETAREEVIVERLNWLEPRPSQATPALELEVSTTGLHAKPGPSTRATLLLHLEGRATLILRTPRPRLLAGAPLVFHDGNRIVATGWVG